MEHLDKELLIESFTEIPTHFVDGQMCLSYNDVLECIKKATIPSNKNIFDELNSMDLHEIKKVHEGLKIIRVPCGWIYEMYNTVGDDYLGQYTATFVPETTQQHQL